MRIQTRLVGFIAVIQSVLFLTHFLFYETWIFSSAGSHDGETLWIKLLLGSLSVSFITASLLGFRYSNVAVRGFYKAAAVWMGLVSFLFLATVSSWITFGVARLAELDVNFHRIVEVLYSAAAVAGFYGVFNALAVGTSHGEEEMRSSLRFLDHPLGSMPRASDSGDPSTASP